MRPAQKTSPVKLHRGGGPVPRRRQQKKQVLGAFGERVPEVKGGRPPPKGSSAVKQKKLSPAALRRKRAADLRRRRRQELSAANKANRSAVRSDNKQAASDLAKFNAARKRQAKKGTPKEPFNPIDKVPGGRPDPLLRAGRKRQAKKATPTARRTAKPVGDRRVPVSRRVPFRGTGKPPTARRTAKPVGDRRVPVSRRIRRR